ncbi:MAG: 3-oxoacyl-[acyl-carrier protein] reductase, partial [Solirubrobacteraceae bacterium]|nr:3-oxoacyl-[acyl-carrier protein] reductase [Solirubrobacteraceae bacterium]
MDLGIADRVALVTGASQGIGRAIAAELAREGARVAVSSRSRERIEEAAADIGATPFVFDSSDLDAVPELVAQVQDALGPIEILVCNTGGPPGNPDPLSFTREQWEAAYRTLVLAPMALIEGVMPGMRERGFGRVLNVVSTSVREPIGNLMLSNAHRASMITAFKTLARAVAGDGVTLNSVLPGRIS